MINRIFERNPNKKLFCTHFATIALKLTGEEKGKTEGIYYKGIYMGTAAINDIYKTKLSKLPEMTCLHATGRTKRDFIVYYSNIMDELHLTEIDPEIYIISYSYIKIKFNAYALPNQ